MIAPDAGGPAAKECDARRHVVSIQDLGGAKSQKLPYTRRRLGLAAGNLPANGLSSNRRERSLYTGTAAGLLLTFLSPHICIA